MMVFLVLLSLFIILSIQAFGFFRATKSIFQNSVLESALSKIRNAKKKTERAYTVDELNRLISGGYRVRDIDVRGDLTSALRDDDIHPIVKLLYERKSKLGQEDFRKDGKKIALAIEGGGMRGCVAAGMVTAIWHLGLDDVFDVIYGSSAGATVGAYFITKQVPHEGPAIYYDTLTTAGKEFIDQKSVLRSAGLGLFDIRPKSLVNLFTDK
jgi:hypothetical protein